ncbi:MAG: hypothetical protein KDC37_00525 [Flavobacteriales bacterium]|nr:hypothetical protein [Flavobacteriales bacterium]
MFRHFFISASLIVLCLCGHHSFAQTAAKKDTTKAPKVVKLTHFRYFNTAQFRTDTTIMDTVKEEVTHLVRFNPYLHNYKSNLGNMGAPQYNLLLVAPRSAVPNFSFDHLDDYRLSLSTFKFYELTQPYARITYYNGAQKEEGIEAFVSANTRPLHNFNILYSKDGSEGFYSRQRTSHNRFGMGGAIRTRTNRYQHVFLLSYSDTYLEENGGLTTDTIFESSESEKLNRRGIPIALSSAKNTSGRRALEGRHQLNFGRKSPVLAPKTDTTQTDSIDYYRVQPLLALIHQYELRQSDYTFEDAAPNALYYGIDSLSATRPIFDKTELTEIGNKLSVEARLLHHASDSEQTTLRLQLGSGAHAFNYHTSSIIDGQNTSLLRLEDVYVPVFGRLIYNTDEWFTAALTGEYIAAGFNMGNTHLRFNSRVETARQIVTIDAGYTDTRPSLLFQAYRSRLYNWQSTSKLNKQQTVHLRAGYTYKPWKVTIFVETYDIKGYVYFDSTSTPRQSNRINTLNAMGVETRQNLGPLHWELSLRMGPGSARPAINLPYLTTYQSLYINYKLFGGDIKMSTEADFFYIANYSGDGYHPGLRSFYSQTGKEIGNTPLIDFFLTAEIDRVQLFAKMAKVLEGGGRYDYYAAYAYPFPDRAFKFGVRWVMLN